MKHFLVLAGLTAGLLAVGGTASAQDNPPETAAPAQATPVQPSPPATATGTIGDATLEIKYCAPSVRGRQIFGEGGRVMKDPTAPIWRAGANAATAFHTSADLTIDRLAVPKGDYTLYVNVQDPDAWVLVISKQTGQFGTQYDASMDLGRVRMDMSKPPSPIELLRYTIASSGRKKGTLQLAWENHIATVAVTAK